MSNNPTEVLVKIVELLKPLSSEERQRVVQASLTMLGDAALPPIAPPSAGGSGADIDFSPSLPARAKIWLKQGGVTAEEMDQVFHIENGAIDFIASWVPGNNDKEKTLNAYIITGTRALLATGTPSFDDKAARQLCEELGCFNRSNHSHYLKDKGNEFTGTKEKGWTLTTPGTKRGATLIKEMAKINS